VYEMYTYDQTGVAATAAPVRSEEKEVEFSAALQWALDRRDNGGDAQGRLQ
jgi:hypothetical protein